MERIRPQDLQTPMAAGVGSHRRLTRVLTFLSRLMFRGDHAMSEQSNSRWPGRYPDGDSFRDPDRFSEGGLRAPPHLSTFGKIWWWFDFLILVKLARLRFIAILVAIGAVIVYWETLHAYY